MINKIRAYFRLLLFVTTITFFIGLALISSIFGGNQMKRNMKIRQRWIRLISGLMQFNIQLEGEIPSGVHLFISNHRSFMDPVAALHFINAYPLSKAEVIKYPLIGHGARLTGVLFVERDNAHSRKGAKDAISQTFQSGHSTLIYPEGTTKSSRTTDHFKKGSFTIAAEMKIPVVPIAIEYQDPKDHWVKRGLMDQYVYQFGKPNCTCKLSFGRPIVEQDAQRLMEKTKAWIDQKLIETRAAFDEGIKDDRQRMKDKR